MGKFVILLVSVALFHAACALKCKTCKDINDTSCKALEDQTCPASPADKEPACLIHIYKANKDSKEEIVEKKCVNRGKDGKYDCIKQKSDEVQVKCDTCTTDLCNEKNGAAHISVGSLAFVAVLALVVPKIL